MPEEKEQLTIHPLPDYPQPIAAALWRMQDSRQRTVNAVKELSQAAIDWQPAGLHNTVGTLLYHIAVIEMDWLFEEVLQQAWTPHIEALFPHPVRAENGYLFPMRDVSLDDHLARLHTTRQCFLDSFKTISLEDFYRLREMPNYDVSPEWVLHHLTRHEDEHRGEILTIRTLAGA